MKIAGGEGGRRWRGCRDSKAPGQKRGGTTKREVMVAEGQSERRRDEEIEEMGHGDQEIRLNHLLSDDLKNTHSAGCQTLGP